MALPAEHFPIEPLARLESTAIGPVSTSLVTLDNGQGTRLRLLGYGATLASFECPDRYGRSGEVVLGFHEASRYLGPHPYFGATVGRFANRIRNARFPLDGREISLEANENGHQLHGGPQGFNSTFFEAALLRGGDHVGASFWRTSPNGEGGFPGNLEVRVEYRLFGDGALRIDFHADTDAPTVANLTHHSYFNLSGGERDIRRHLLTIEADRYIPLDGEGIPTGGTLAVDGTAFDFRSAHRVGDRLADAVLTPRGGYDHPFVIRGTAGDLRQVATLKDPESGRRLDVLSDQPVLQLYTGQLLDPDVTGHEPFGALCLETGQAPDCVNQPDLGSAWLRPGEHYHHTVIYRFGVDG